MSKYTTEVRFVCEYNAGLTKSVGYQSVNEIINQSYAKIFDFDFPIFDENYRPLLCKKILKHFYTREIGEETVGLWKLRLDTRMNEIMPYYNQLYESELIKFNPMYDVDLTRDHTLRSDGTREFEENTTDNVRDNGTQNDTTHATGERDDSTSATGKTVTKFSDTPQGSLQNVENGSYLTDATIVDSTDSGTLHSETEDNGTLARTTSNTRNSTGDLSHNETIGNLDSFLEHVVGKTGGRSYSSLLKEFRETFLNIDMMIIDELDDLFMQVW